MTRKSAASFLVAAAFGGAGLRIVRGELAMGADLAPRTCMR
jgi:hypothetical protein